MRCRWAVLLAFLTFGCGGDEREPLDGGVPLSLNRGPEADDIMARGPCWRREKGGWHYSAGHCEEMGPQHEVTGVFVTAFEERSFFPGATAIPDANDPVRFTQEIELDERRLERLAGPIPGSPNGDAYLITFLGRRMRDPYSVDCQGMPYYAWVVDRLHSARRLGAMPPFRIEVLRARPVTVARRHGGRRGELEQEAVERCRADD